MDGRDRDNVKGKKMKRDFIPTEVIHTGTPITKNFLKEEFACPCGCGENAISFRLIYALQELRDAIGKPITITSGFRCAKHNKEVGGAKSSQHLLGWAADIFVAHFPIKDLFEAILKIPTFRNGGIGVASGFIHVDIREGEARWSYAPDGKVIAFVRPS